MTQGEDRPKDIPHHWNWQRSGDGIEVCRGEHDRSAACEWEDWPLEDEQKGSVKDE